MSEIGPRYQVRAVHCDHQASEDEVYAALKRATDPLERAWAKLRAAKRICMKFNQDFPPDQQVRFRGQLQQLVSEKVVRATLRLLRENTDADLCCADISYGAVYSGLNPRITATALPILREFNVEYINGNEPPFGRYAVPGGGQMFRQYLLSQRVVDVDAFVSVSKMKNHKFMGVTLCLKNLFGLMPAEPHGHTRPYFHHFVRLPHVLVDLGLIFRPALSIVDALISQAGQEWGDEPARITDTLIAGDQVIATDACGTYLMGHNPQSDWLRPPFHRERNALLIASEAGFGTVNLDEIDFQSEVQSPLAKFYANVTDPESVVVNWRRTTAEQALYYRDHLRDFVGEYAGDHILLQDGEVRWHDSVGTLGISRRRISRDWRRGLWLKYVDPEETEGEQYRVYEQVLAQA